MLIWNPKLLGKRNDEENAKEKLFTYATYVPVDSFKVRYHFIQIWTVNAQDMIFVLPTFYRASRLSLSTPSKRLLWASGVLFLCLSHYSSPITSSIHTLLRSSCHLLSRYAATPTIICHVMPSNQNHAFALFEGRKHVVWFVWVNETLTRSGSRNCLYLVSFQETCSDEYTSIMV